MHIKKEEKLNLTTDYVFKRIFGHVGNESVTADLINSIIEEKVDSLSIESSEVLEQDIIDDKVGVLDVLATFSDGTKCNIEMQCSKQDYFEKRMLYYWSKLYSQNIVKGSQYGELKKCKVIALVDFDMDKVSKLPTYFSQWNLREKSYPEYILTNDIELYIIDLAKYKNGIRHDKRLDDWLNLICEKEVNMENEEIKKANEILEEISRDPEERRKALAREIALMDKNTAIGEATKRGIEQGLEQGIKQGIKQGKELGEKSNSIKMAKKLKEKNMDIKEIAEITELTVEEIEKL